jgi:hypothetical protein
MKNNKHIYICIQNAFLCILIPSLFNTVSAQVTGKKPEGTLQPQLFVSPDQPYQEEKVQEDTKSNKVLFAAKTLAIVEESLNSSRPYFMGLKAERLLDISIKGIYQPAANPENTMCDMVVADGFDKASLPDLSSDFRKELVKVMKPETINEVQYCLNYLGIYTTDADFYIYYVAPYKNELLALLSSKLQGRELAWIIANDFQQCVCNRKPIIQLSKELEQKMQSRQDKLNN